MHSISVRLTLLLTGTPAQYAGYVAQPAPQQVQLITVLDWVGLGVVSLIGVTWLLVEWRTAPRQRDIVRGWRGPPAREGGHPRPPRGRGAGVPAPPPPRPGPPRGERARAPPRPRR